MRIGIDCRTAADSAGIGEYTRQSVKQLIKQNSHDEFVLFFSDASAAEKFSGDKVKTIILPFYRYKKFLPLVYSQLIIPWLMNNQRLAVCWFPANIIPLGYRGRTVVTIHDLAVYIQPELFPDKLINFDRRYLVPSSLRRANKIIAVSNSTKQDIIKLFKIPAEKIAVIYEGVEVAVQPPVRPKENYLLYLGTIEPRKNLVRLIKAFKRLKQTEPMAADLKLILAGKNGWKNEEVFTALSEANRELKIEAIEYLGYVSAEKKPALLMGAKAFVFPSLYEGFGLPVLEAMAYGVPVVTAQSSSLPEVGGEAVLYVDPLSEEEIFSALRKIITDEKFRQELIIKGQQKSQEFTWDKSARQTKELLTS